MLTDIINQLANDIDVDESGLQHLFKFFFIRLQDSKHRDAFILDSKKWIDSVIDEWDIQNKKFFNLYMNDDEFKKEFNNKVMDELQ